MSDSTLRVLRNTPDALILHSIGGSERVAPVCCWITGIICCPLSLGLSLCIQKDVAKQGKLCTVQLRRSGDSVTAEVIWHVPPDKCCLRCTASLCCVKDTCNQIQLKQGEDAIFLKKIRSRNFSRTELKLRGTEPGQTLTIPFVGTDPESFHNLIRDWLLVGEKKEEHEQHYPRMNDSVDFLTVPEERIHYGDSQPTAGSLCTIL